MKELGGRIRELRIRRRMTLEELGGIVGLSKQAVSQWERGVSVPDLTKLAELSRFFDVSIGELTGTPADKTSIDEELNQLDPTTAHVLRQAFHASIRALKTPKKD